MKEKVKFNVLVENAWVELGCNEKPYPGCVLKDGYHGEVKDHYPEVIATFETVDDALKEIEKYTPKAEFRETSYRYGRRRPIAIWDVTEYYYQTVYYDDENEDYEELFGSDGFKDFPEIRMPFMSDDDEEEEE